MTFYIWYSSCINNGNRVSNKYFATDFELWMDKKIRKLGNFLNRLGTSVQNLTKKLVRKIFSEKTWFEISRVFKSREIFFLISQSQLRFLISICDVTREISEISKKICMKFLSPKLYGCLPKMNCVPRSSYISL